MGGGVSQNPSVIEKMTKQGLAQDYTQRIEEGNIVRQKLSRLKLYRLRPHRLRLSKVRPHRLRPYKLRLYRVIWVKGWGWGWGWGGPTKLYTRLLRFVKNPLAGEAGRPICQAKLDGKFLGVLGIFSGISGNFRL